MCPNCHRHCLSIEHVLALGGDAYSDEIRFQLWRCSDCGFTAAGAYQESRRGSLDHDCFEHEAYQVSLAEWAELERTVSICPNPEQEECGCCAHQHIGKRAANDCWTLSSLLKSPGFRFSPTDR